MSAVAVRETQNDFRLDRADVLAVDPVAANRSALRASLETIGFRRITLMPAVADAIDRLRDRPFDLFVADITQNSEKSCALVRSMREGKAGENPFLHIVLMAWKLDNDILRQALNCGADDFVTRPFSLAFLTARIKALMTARADFVVTSDYVGPDRRRDQLRRRGVSTFTAPNSLRTKCSDSVDPAWAAAALSGDIATARIKVHVERTQKTALKLPLLVQLLKETYAREGPLEPGFVELHATVNDIVERVRESSAGEVLPIALQLRNAVDAAQARSNFSGHVDTIDSLATDLYLAITPGSTTDNLRRDVDRARASIKARATRI